MTDPLSVLVDFGWNTFFESQLEPDERAHAFAGKVVEVHRGTIRVVGPNFDKILPAFTTLQDDEETAATVGDWLLFDPVTLEIQRLLQRASLFKRRAPGTERKMQQIAANIDTLFIVTSCNQDFNTARLERYLVLAAEADVRPVLVLTKADMSDSPEDYISAGEGLLPNLLVEAVDARVPTSVASLNRWCAQGSTVAVVGSSGVGKSTLVNTLRGSDEIETQDIREDDAKGRHTTTGRTFYRLPAGGWLLDTPGMRGLDVSEARRGLEIVFDDIISITRACKFSDCKHDPEPGCAVQAAIVSGALDAKRFKRWQKLVIEEADEGDFKKNLGGRKFMKRSKKTKKVK